MDNLNPSSTDLLIQDSLVVKKELKTSSLWRNQGLARHDVSKGFAWFFDELYISGGITEARQKHTNTDIKYSSLSDGGRGVVLGGLFISYLEVRLRPQRSVSGVEAKPRPRLLLHGPAGAAL